MKLFGTVIAVLFHPGSASKINGKRRNREREREKKKNHFCFDKKLRLGCVSLRESLHAALNEGLRLEFRVFFGDPR